MLFKNFLIWFIPIVLGVILLIVIRNVTKPDYNHRPKRFHILLYFIGSLIPFVGLFAFISVLIFYFIDIENFHIKPNKFTKFWFDIDENK